MLPIAWTMRHAACAIGAALALSSPLAAQSVDFGLTGDVKDGAIGGSLAVHGAPVFTTSHGLSGAWGVAARADNGGNAWVGAGFSLNYALSDTTFVEASFMPGHYSEGDRDLGGNLQFRSLVGFGWAVSPQGALILSLDHISNANTQSYNPGTETVALSWRMAF